jgi:hypothetical protein
MQGMVIDGFHWLFFFLDWCEWWWNHYAFWVQPFIHHGTGICIELCVVESFSEVSYLDAFPEE